MACAAAVAVCGEAACAAAAVAGEGIRALRSHRLQASAWRVPGFYAVGALAAGIVLPRIEAQYFPGLASPISATAATALYSSIASGMIALTGLVFSVMFVMVQFSATAYSPSRVVAR